MAISTFPRDLQYGGHISVDDVTINIPGVAAGILCSHLELQISRPVTWLVDLSVGARFASVGNALGSITLVKAVAPSETIQNLLDVLTSCSMTTVVNINITQQCGDTKKHLIITVNKPILDTYQFIASQGQGIIVVEQLRASFPSLSFNYYTGT